MIGGYTKRSVNAVILVITTIIFLLLKIAIKRRDNTVKITNTIKQRVIQISNNSIDDKKVVLQELEKKKQKEYEEEQKRIEEENKNLSEQAELLDIQSE